MDLRMQAFLEKMKIVANRTGQVAGYAADAAGKKASEIASATKMNLQIFDLNTECDVLLREIGEIVYDIHNGLEADSAELDLKMELLDEKQEKIAQLRAQLGTLKPVITCPVCGKQCSKDDAFCAGCGNPLHHAYSVSPDNTIEE